MAFPGILKRAELATGLLIKSICVNGDYLVVDSCDINQTQESDVKNYIQGGPAYAVFNIGAKKFEGSISFPLRVDRNNNIESAAETLLRHAAKPMQALRIDTNHVITPTIATVNDYATDNNILISLDAVMINSLKITADENQPVKITISFTGMVDGNEKKNILARADIFCLPSDAEGFSIAILEAMASETAVLISPGCHFEKVQERFAGRIVDANVYDLVKVLSELLLNMDIVKKMGKNGRELVSSKYSWDSISDKMINTYIEGIARNNLNTF